MTHPAEQEPSVRSRPEIEPPFTIRDWCEAILEHGEFKALDDPEDAGKIWEGQKVLGVAWGLGTSSIEYRLFRVEMPSTDRWIPYTSYILNIHPRPHSPVILEAFHHLSDVGRTFKHDGKGKWAERNGEKDYVGLHGELLRHLRTAPEEWWPSRNSKRLPDAQVDLALAGIAQALSTKPPRKRGDRRLPRQRRKSRK